MLSHNNQSSLSSNRISNADLNELPIDEYKTASILLDAVEAENGKKQDDYKEVDAGKLSPAEKQLFIDKIIEVVEEDNGRFLKKLRKRIDRIGIQLPTIQIRFEHLSVQAKCHVGSRALPTLFNSTMNFVESTIGFLGVGQTKLANLAILKNVYGILKPSRMTLLLGPPASGKTTLLLALAGILDSNLESKGDVTYNGYRLDEFVPQKTAAYISQYDLHVGEMTVKETLDFSARCQGIGSRYDLLKELAKKEKEANISPDPEVNLFMKATAQNGIKSSLQTDYILKILGLDMCADTIIGHEMLRGISGGQKKRLTTGEMIVGPTKTLFMDEISTGLDSSTTYQIVSCLKHIVQLGEATVLMSLLQPAPETFNLFDDIILLCEGQIVYQGPTEYVLDFFKSCGFECPKRKGTADFLQEVTSKKDQQQYWAKGTQSYHFISVSDFANRFKRFHIGLALENELSLPFDKMKSHKAALVFSKNLVPISELLMASFDKEWLLIKRNSSVYVFLIVKLIIVAAITSTVFLKTQMYTNTEGDGAVYLGALIYGVIITMFNGFTELAFSMFRLPVFFKQRDLLFYPAWVFTLPNIVVKIPISILESFVWVSITYYSIGLAPEASRFFKMLLIIILIQQTAAGLFRLVAAIFRTMVGANGGGSMVILCFFVLGGFLIPKDKIPSWWIWGYWISPMPYAYNAIAVNEFLSPRWMDKFAPDGRRLGVAVLENGSIFVDKNWYWIGAGALLVYTIICNVSFTLALTYLNSPGRQQAIISEDILDTDDKPDEAKEYSSKTSNQNLSPNDGSYSRNTVQRGMILPFTPLTMSFKDLNYHVDMPAEMKAQGVQGDKLELLKGVTGAFHPGVLTALMGISGAGKTTLMDVLSGRKTGGYIEGDVRISGYPKNQATFARISGYCEQNDIHSPQVTVKESLIYSAFLRLPPDVTANKKMKFVDDVMELVELENIKDAVVGLPGISGLSTEQRKRLTVAVELVSNPSIIFMDEPTSGLDARSAAIVMRAVRNTVNTGRTVVCTIHQPSIDIFESFDELLLLKRGGQVVYSGPLGDSSQKMIEYFESIPGIVKIKDQYNPATWMLEVSSTAIEVKLDINFAEIYRSSSLFKINNEIVDALREPVPGTEDLHFPTQHAQSNYEQFKSCLWKQMLTYWRSPDYNMTRFLFSWSSAFVLGSMFWNIGKRRESSSDIVMTLAAMFAAVLFAGFQNAATVQPVVATERTVFYRETAAGMYSGLPYAFAQMAMEIPYVFIQTVFYVIIIYSMFGLEWTVDKFFWFFFVAFFTFLYFTYYGMMFVAISPDVQVAGLLCATFFTLFNLFCGFFIPKSRIPKWWVWYYWVNPVQWTLNGLITTQFGDLEDMITVPGQASQSIKSYIGDQFGLHLDFMYAVALVLVGFNLLFAFVFAFGIKKLNFQQR